MYAVCTLIYTQTHTFTDSIVLPWWATNSILLLLLLHRRRRLQFLILQLCNIVAHYGLRFWHGWAVLICSWQQIFYHVAFTVILFLFLVFWCATQYITRKSNYASYAISKCLLFSRPMSWCFDLLKYYLLLFCSSFTFKLSGTNGIYDELRHFNCTHCVFDLSVFMCFIARVSGHTFFHPPLALCFRSINEAYQIKYK